MHIEISISKIIKSQYCDRKKRNENFSLFLDKAEFIIIERDKI